MTELPDKSNVTVAELAALHFLDQLRFRPFERDALFDYYGRNGPTSVLSTVSRRGAAGRMWRRLIDKGLIDDGWLTPAGRRALNAAGL